MWSSKVLPMLDHAYREGIINVVFYCTYEPNKPDGLSKKKVKRTEKRCPGDPFYMPFKVRGRHFRVLNSAIFPAVMCEESGGIYSFEQYKCICPEGQIMQNHNDNPGCYDEVDYTKVQKIECSGEVTG